jgi:hypothetical protein
MHFKHLIPIACGLVVFTACSDSSGPDGEARVYMSSTTASANLVASASSSSESEGSIPLTAVDSINIVLTSIQAVSTSDSAGGVTLSLQGDGTKVLNLMDLSALGSDSTLVARGDLPAGTYNNVRLRFSSATITLNQDVIVGTSSYPAGTYDLTVPSGLSSGIKVQGSSFTVADDASTSITLSFDETATVGTIVATGANKLMMSPVVHVRTHTSD